MIVLRPVAKNDREIFVESSYGIYPEEALRHMLEDSIAGEHEGRYYRLLAVLQEDNCVGFISLYGQEDNTISMGPEIKPQFRRRGVAFAAMGQAMTFVKQMGFTKAVAQVRTDNIASIALHKKLGFQMCKEYVNKKGHSVFWLEKELYA